jgi:hypothetical protein
MNIVVITPTICVVYLESPTKKFLIGKNSLF